jgi:lipopolysaccharide export system protein LptA
MVTIKFFWDLPAFFRFKFRFIIYVSFILLLSPELLSQVVTKSKSAKKIIEIKNADEDIIVKDLQTGKDIHHFKGKVHIVHNAVTMWCDSAHYSADRNQVKAFSKVHIVQGDTLNLFGNYLFYDGKTEIAIVTGKVELVDKDTHLFTDSINYDVKNKIARYTEKGRITNAKNTLTSITGIYYVSESLFHFKDSVKIVNPEYVVTADTMDYNSKSELAIFTGPTFLKGDSLNLYCEKGWYDTKNKITSIWINAMINNRKQIVHGDSLYYNDSIGYGEAFRNVIIEDTTRSMTIEGNYAWYYKQPERFLVTDRAVFIQISKGDSLFLHADTLRAITISDSLSNVYRLMKAYHGCRIFSKSLQAKCDSLSYSFRDSVIRLYTKPIIWNEENQLTSDSMAIYTKNMQTERMELYNSAFITSQVDTIQFNQIKGRSLTGYFKNNELSKIDIKGNGESIYYLIDGEDITGVNQTKCANFEVYLDKGKITEIYEFQSPEGQIDPPEKGKPNELRLKGFNWFDSLRPKKQSDIFNK